MATAIVPYDTTKASTPEMALVVKTSEQEGRLGNMLESVKAQVQEVMLSMRQGTSADPVNLCTYSCTHSCTYSSTPDSPSSSHRGLSCYVAAEPEKARENQAKLTDLMGILKQIESHQQHLLNKTKVQKQEVSSQHPVSTRAHPFAASTCGHTKPTTTKVYPASQPANMACKQ